MIIVVPTKEPTSQLNDLEQGKPYVFRYDGDGSSLIGLVGRHHSTYEYHFTVLSVHGSAGDKVGGCFKLTDKMAAHMTKFHGKIVIDED